MSTEVRWTEFHFVADYHGQGPRVLAITGPAWTEVLRRHYGIQGKAFCRRQALPIEPSTDEKGHPWGWVHTPKDFLKEEARWYDNKIMEHIKGRLDQAMQQALKTTESLVTP